MISTAAALVLMVAIFAVVLFIARRLLRLAIKLAFIGAVILALTAGGLFGWWRGWFESSATNNQRPTAVDRAPHNTNRRPTPR